MVKALFDSNILIDHLNGIAMARSELERHGDAAISRITWIEVLCGADREGASPVRAFLANFFVVDLSPAIAERTVMLRREHRLRIPDAIIWASAQVEGRLLVSREERAFPRGDPAVRIPYRL